MKRNFLTRNDKLNQSKHLQICTIYCLFFFKYFRCRSSKFSSNRHRKLQPFRGTWDWSYSVNQRHLSPNTIYFEISSLRRASDYKNGTSSCDCHKTISHDFSERFESFQQRSRSIFTILAIDCKRWYYLPGRPQKPIGVHRLTKPVDLFFNLVQNRLNVSCSTFNSHPEYASSRITRWVHTSIFLNLKWI